MSRENWEYFCKKKLILTYCLVQVLFKTWALDQIVKRSHVSPAASRKCSLPQLGNLIHPKWCCQSVGAGLVFYFSTKIYKKAEHFQIIFNFPMLQKNKKHHQFQGQYLHRSCAGYRCLDRTLNCPNLWLLLLGVDQSLLASACPPVFEQMTAGFNWRSQILGTFLVTESEFILQLTHRVWSAATE